MDKMLGKVLAKLDDIDETNNTLIVFTSDHVHTYIHTYVHIYIHTYIHTYLLT